MLYFILKEVKREKIVHNYYYSLQAKNWVYFPVHIYLSIYIYIFFYLYIFKPFFFIDV